MSARDLVMSAAGATGSTPLYVDDVFSAYTYTGNGSTQTINNGIDLAGKGGLVWIKSRTYGDNGGVPGNHVVLDSEVYNYLNTNTTNAASAFNKTETSGSALTFTSTGFTETSLSGGQYVSWTFRKAPKFFDVVTYTGDGTSNRSIAHSLGVAPGMIIVKTLDATVSGAARDWSVYHQSLGAGNVLKLNRTDANTVSSGWFPTTPASSVFYVGNQADVNGSGATYVAYLFAHDTAADGIIQCGACTAGVVNLGWEPQYLLIKRMDSDGNWLIRDSMRGMPVSGNAKNLLANTSDAESTGGSFTPTATGFDCSGVGPGTYIYLAIRRPNKPPTTGTQVFSAIARTGTGAAATVTGVGFAPDMVWPTLTSVAHGTACFDRLRGPLRGLIQRGIDAERTDTDSLLEFTSTGVKLGADSSYDINPSGYNVISWYFRRAPGFFDVVCYTGTGSNRTVNHSLGVAPELVIVKSRSAAYGWNACFSFGETQFSQATLNATDSAFVGTYGVSGVVQAKPTAATITNSAASGVNQNGQTYVAYLFASLPGVSKVGTYTGNGSSQTINCGFSAGARFILVKRTDAAGDWVVWDTARGIVSANDPHLSLNTTAAEVTTNDSVDPDSTGFIVNQNSATNINVASATYLYLAIA